jgi:hypothetical protein
MHQWSFLPGATADSNLVIAVCSVCGVIRSARVSSSTKNESGIDLGGTCSGQPQEPPAQPRPRAFSA